ncbi:hypothetical protein K1719_025853 [Acacia pycnantha]|nr:hypothetical protein K1719_025853 [Acacia pycnantha]
MNRCRLSYLPSHDKRGANGSNIFSFCVYVANVCHGLENESLSPGETAIVAVRSVYQCLHEKTPHLHIVDAHDEVTS